MPIGALKVGTAGPSLTMRVAQQLHGAKGPRSPSEIPAEKQQGD
jgi:hypothetical protein